jgi:hypothetical protein
VPCRGTGKIGDTSEWPEVNEGSGWAIAAEHAKTAEAERAKSELLRQIADLQRVLGDEKTRASKLETKLEMMETQIIPRIAEEMQAKLKRRGIT